MCTETKRTYAEEAVEYLSSALQDHMKQYRAMDLYFKNHGDRVVRRQFFFDFKETYEFMELRDGSFVLVRSKGADQPMRFYEVEEPEWWHEYDENPDEE
jgi:hypothetical protein